MGIDLGNWLAGFLRHVFGGKSDWEFFEDCAPIEPGPFGSWHPSRRSDSRASSSRWSLQHALPARCFSLERSEFPLALGDLCMHRLHDAGKLCRQAIPTGAACTAPMLPHSGSRHVKIGRNRAQYCRLIFAEEMTVALDIGMKEGGELAFHTHCTRGILLLLSVG